ncbi:MAG: carboxymuconolactone decarboxylase family protein [Ktedonobacteraceae bacterium]|nr:carboxymuconolactone decarboxylase family protein [Ktedonobacteraceae bacterium]
MTLRHRHAGSLRAAIQNVGVDPREIAEVLLHVAVYAGVPAANNAFAVAKKILDQPAPAPAETDPPGEDV